MPYQCQIYETHLPMDTSMMGFHYEMGIRNYTGEQLIVMLPNGSTYRVDPISQFTDPNPRIHVESVIRDHYNHVYDSTKNSANPQCVATVTLDVLQNGPVPLTEFNMVVALSKYSYLLPEFNIFNREYYNKKIEQDIRKYWEQPGYGSPMFVVANSHSVTQQSLYMIINNTILKYNMVHDFSREESLDLWIQAYNGWRKIEFSDLKWDKLNTSVQALGDTEWIISTNYELLNKYLQERRLKESSKMSKEDAELYIKSQTQSYVDEISALKDQVANLLREIEFLKKSLLNSENELRAANEGARRSYEQNLYRQKERNLERESALLHEKRMFAREQDEMAELQRYRRAETDYHLSRIKAESDIDIARAKVDKERIGLASAEASNLGTYAKVASVVVPTMVGVGMWLANKASSLHPVAMATGAGIYAASKLARPIVSIVKNTANTVKCAVKNLWSRIWD